MTEIKCNKCEQVYKQKKGFRKVTANTANNGYDYMCKSCRKLLYKNRSNPKPDKIDNKMTDIRHGGELRYKSGDSMKSLGVKPNEDRVFLALWDDNGSFISTYCHAEPQEGSSYSRRIRLVTKIREKKINVDKEILLTIEDAEYIIEGLKEAILTASDVGLQQHDR